MSKSLLYLSIGVIITWFLFPIIGLFIHFEISDSNLSEYYFYYRIYSLPIALLMTLFGTLKTNDSFKIRAQKVFWTLLAFGVSFLFVLFNLFAGMCAWNTEKLYQRADNNDITIASRYINCGAYDSDIPKRKIYKVYQITPYFIFAIKSDTVSLNKKIWIPITNSN